MKKSSKITGAVLAATIATAPVFNLAYAETASPDVTPAPTAEQMAPELMSQIKVSEVGRNAVTGIHFAKQALVNGDSDAAKAILDEVKGMFSDKDAGLVVKTDSGYVLPLEQGFGLPESFTPTDAHAPVFAEADVLMQSGDINGVIDAFNQAGIDLVSQVAVIPYTATIDSVTQAVADIDAGKLDKAGTDLDAVLASVTVESFEPGAPPVQGYAPADISQS